MLIIITMLKISHNNKKANNISTRLINTGMRKLAKEEIHICHALTPGPKVLVSPLFSIAKG